MLTGLASMIVLGMDTATTACSAALWADGRVLAHRFEAMERGQAERLNPMIGEVMGEAGVEFGDLAGVAVTTGPGAFTGLRIGLAAARAIGLAVAVPVIGVTTFDVLARAVPAEERVGRLLVVAVNGKRRDVFYQVFGPDGVADGPGGALEPGKAAGGLPEGPLLIAGDGAQQLRDGLAACAEAGDGPEARIRFSSALTPPDAGLVAEIGAERLDEGADVPVPPRPLYIRPPDARLPQRRLRRGGRVS
jgi:tRNA threonylcarbamoyladenosine biosynthesis protein TsaB